jgi:hypothetical protein
MSDPFYLIKGGYITLQISDIEVVEVDGQLVAKEDRSTLPKDWYFVLHNGYMPCVGKEKGFTHWTRNGWELNKDKIKELYEQAIAGEWNRGETWADFEEYVEKFFAAVKKNIAKKKKALKAQISTLEELDLLF